MPKFAAILTLLVVLMANMTSPVNAGNAITMCPVVVEEHQLLSCFKWYNRYIVGWMEDSTSKVAFAFWSESGDFLLGATFTSEKAIAIYSEDNKLSISTTSGESEIYSFYSFDDNKVNGAGGAVLANGEWDNPETLSKFGLHEEFTASCPELHLGVDVVDYPMCLLTYNPVFPIVWWGEGSGSKASFAKILDDGYAVPLGFGTPVAVPPLVFQDVQTVFVYQFNDFQWAIQGWLEEQGENPLFPFKEVGYAIVSTNADPSVLNGTMPKLP